MYLGGIDQIIQIHACITWGVELIQANFFHLFDVLTDMTTAIHSCLFSMTGKRKIGLGVKGKSWWASEETCAERVNILQNIKYEEDKDRCVNSVCVMHVGGTRCVTSSTGNNTHPCSDHWGC